MPPDRSTIDKAELDRLIRVYRKAEKDILDTVANATDFGQARRAEQLLQIDTILTQLGSETGDWLGQNIPAQYTRGTTDLIKQLQSINVELKESSTMSIIDRRAVAAMISETQEAFAAGLTAVSKNAARVLSNAAKEAIKDELATGRILGETRKEVSARIKAAIQRDGISALVDKGGRPWSLDRYAEMLARTKMVEARNTGLANKMVANGYDLVEVSMHMSDHKECARYEGKILSLTGKTPGYPTLEQAMRNGLLHPNCQHQINAVRTDYAAITTAYDPRTGSYHQPFKTNPPATPKKQLTVPNDTPKATPSLSLIRNSRVYMNAAGKDATFKLTDLEDRFVGSSGIKITTTDGAVIRNGRRAAPNTRGYFSPSENKIVMRHVHNESDKQTFYHELGHAIDFTAYKVIDQFTGKLRFAGSMQTAIRRDTTAIVARRIQSNYGEKYTISFAEAQKVAAGKLGKFKEKSTGKVIEGGVKASWRKYARTQEEVFADAYGRYRLEPKKFEAYAPDMYNEFKRLGL